MMSASSCFQKLICLWRLLYGCVFWQQNFLFVLNEGAMFPRSYLKRHSTDPMNSTEWWTHELLKKRSFGITGNASAVWQDTATHGPGPSRKRGIRAVPACPREPASLLMTATHRSAECRPERDTLLATGDGRLLPLCRSSMDLLQGFDLSTELSTVLSTLSKSKLKQEQNATEDIKIQSHTNTWMWVTCSSFLVYICILIQVVFAK